MIRIRNNGTLTREVKKYTIYKHLNNEQCTVKKFTTKYEHLAVEKWNHILNYELIGVRYIEFYIGDVVPTNLEHRIWFKENETIEVIISTPYQDIIWNKK